MEITTSKGTSFQGTVTELFALEAGMPYFTKGNSKTNVNPPRRTKCTDIYGNTVIFPSARAAFRFYRKIGGTAITSNLSFYDKIAKKNSFCDPSKRRGRMGGKVVYAQYTFTLADI